MNNEQLRDTGRLLLERARALAPGVDPRVALAGLGGVLLLVVVILVAVARPSGDSAVEARSAGDIRQQIVCHACDYDQHLTLREIRALNRTPDGTLHCPACQQPTADRYRAGGTRVIKPKGSG